MPGTCDEASPPFYEPAVRPLSSASSLRASVRLEPSLSTSRAVTDFSLRAFAPPLLPCCHDRLAVCKRLRLRFSAKTLTLGPSVEEKQQTQRVQSSSKLLHPLRGVHPLPLRLAPTPTPARLPIPRRRSPAPAGRRHAPARRRSGGGRGSCCCCCGRGVLRPCLRPALLLLVHALNGSPDNVLPLRGHHDAPVLFQKVRGLLHPEAPPVLALCLRLQKGELRGRKGEG
jgi:hypothetical protein